MTIEEKAKAYDEAINQAKKELQTCGYMDCDAARQIFRFFPELRESEDERIRKSIVETIKQCPDDFLNPKNRDGMLEWLEKQKENPKNAISIPADCMSSAKCEDRWHKIQDSLPDNGRLVLANDCLGNTLLARYDGEGNWEVSVYDNDDYYCRNTITKWCDIPSEKQKEQNREDEGHTDFTIYHPLKNGKGKYECIPYSFYGSLTSFSEDKDLIDFLRTCFYTKEECNEWIKQQKEQKPAEWSEEDGAKLGELINYFEGDALDYSTDDIVDWLKSIRSKHHWKPSEEQMYALAKAVTLYGGGLDSLYQDLKKLM